MLTSVNLSSSFVLACIYTTGMLGPMAGFMLGSYLAKTYVDIGFVDLGMKPITVIITMIKIKKGSLKDTCNSGNPIILSSLDKQRLSSTVCCE